jgi:DNA-binding transcriptional ArsR family regulator
VNTPADADEATPDDAAAPANQVVGTESLKGLAHPLRLQLLTELNARGSATASQLASVLGESSGATSYHLRQLHRHGFVEEDPSRGTGRERVWIPRRGGWSLPVFDLVEDPASASAVDLVLRAQMQADQERLAGLLVRAPTWPQEWRDVAVRRDTHVTLDPEQVEQMRSEVDAVIDRYRNETSPGTGARRVSVVYVVMPTEHEASP